MLPAILSEQLIHSFAFWDNGKIHQGMRCGTGFYRHVATFAPNQSQQAYSLGIALCQQQPCALTRADDGYTVWLALRSDEAHHERATASDVYALQR